MDEHKPEVQSSAQKKDAFACRMANELPQYPM